MRAWQRRRRWWWPGFRLLSDRLPIQEPPRDRDSESRLLAGLRPSRPEMDDQVVGGKHQADLIVGSP